MKEVLPVAARWRQEGEVLLRGGESRVELGH